MRKPCVRNWRRVRLRRSAVDGGGARFTVVGGRGDDGGGGGGSKSIDPHRLVREDLSAMMIYAAMSDGGRPLGLQLLVGRHVGQHRIRVQHYHRGRAARGLTA